MAFRSRPFGFSFLIVLGDVVSAAAVADQLHGLAIERIRLCLIAALLPLLRESRGQAGLAEGKLLW